VELQVLNGMEKVLSVQKNIKIAVCTYHRKHDAEEMNNILLTNGFHTEFSKGYMIFPNDNELTEPYLRKGLIRAKK
jgi:hypothetical protein